MSTRHFAWVTALLLIGVAASLPTAYAQASATPPTTNAAAAAGAVVPADFVIGPEDVLGVVFWRDQDMTGDATVRPDGMITVPLIGDIKAAGLRPDALRNQIQLASKKFITDASVSVVVRQINSRKVFITGQVANPGAYSLVGPRTVMQIIALAGGLTEYADAKNITVMRSEKNETRSYKFNYRDVAKGKSLQQNIQLLPGDTVVVP